MLYYLISSSCNDWYTRLVSWKTGIEMCVLHDGTEEEEVRSRTSSYLFDHHRHQVLNRQSIHLNLVPSLNWIINSNPIQVAHPISLKLDCHPKKDSSELCSTRRNPWIDFSSRATFESLTIIFNSSLKSNQRQQSTIEPFPA